MEEPGAEDRDLGMDDYRTLGVMEALKAVATVVPGRKVHAVGYCLGGTMLAITAAALARDGDDRLRSMTLLAAQTDFTEPGELALFIDESEVALLEDVMWDQGVLDSRQMGGAFQLLRSNDLIWSRVVHDYYLGERAPMNDLMAWNADGTRLPSRMHSEYPAHQLPPQRPGRGRFRVGGRPISLSDIRVPIFVVGTVKDHVAPWRSVFKIHRLAGTDVTFVLTSGGHNAGIVSEPGHPRRQYQMATHAEGAPYVDADTWQAITPSQEGSWWLAWESWLDRHSSGPAAVPPMGAPEAGLLPLANAPGSYVLQE